MHIHIHTRKERKEDDSRHRMPKFKHGQSIKKCVSYHVTVLIKFLSKSKKTNRATLHNLHSVFRKYDPRGTPVRMELYLKVFSDALLEFLLYGQALCPVLSPDRKGQQNTLNNVLNCAFV